MSPTMLKLEVCFKEIAQRPVAHKVISIRQRQTIGTASPMHFVSNKQKASINLVRTSGEIESFTKHTFY